jgi:hypothetical protein
MHDLVFFPDEQEDVKVCSHICQEGLAGELQDIGVSLVSNFF